MRHQGIGGNSTQSAGLEILQSLADLLPGVHHERPVMLHMLADGLTTREIAEELSYSERTVKNIVHDVLEKLGCRTRAHAVAIATRAPAT